AGDVPAMSIWFSGGMMTEECDRETAQHESRTLRRSRSMGPNWCYCLISSSARTPDFIPSHQVAIQMVAAAVKLAPIIACRAGVNWKRNCPARDIRYIDD